jgi:PHP domain
MSTAKYPRGSEWRKWDLHFHTPASFDYQDKSLTPEAIVDYLVKKEVAAVAVTDHQFMDVKFIKAMQRAGAGRITVFPGIELRSQLGGSEHVHYIGIFPEDCDLSHVWTTLQGKCDMTTQGIAARGGDEGFYVEIEKGCPIIKDLGGIVTIHAGKKGNGIEELGNAEAVKRTVKKELATKYIHALEVGQKRDLETYQKIVFPHIGLKLPLILCSDNHNAKNYITKENLWIKADPTFQ